MTLPDDAAPADVDRAVAQRGFSRYVLVNDAGEPTGYLHLKDVLDLDGDEYTEPVPPRRIRRLISIGAAVDRDGAVPGPQYAVDHGQPKPGALMRAGE